MHSIHLRSMLLKASVLLCLCFTSLHSQSTSSAKQRTIDALRQEDDTDHPSENTPAAIGSFEQRERDRCQEVRGMLAAGKLLSAGDLYKAAFVLQHGETADDYLLAHVLAVDSLSKGNADARWLVASTLDRYLQLAGRAQIFGTQYPLDPNKPHPVNVEHHARYKGRTQEPFDDRVLPESIRADFCVPSLAQQKLNLEAFDNDRYPDNTLVAATCKR